VEPEGGLLERQDVTAAAGELVGRVAAGGAGALFVVGEAGQGKTSVIGLACRQAGEAGLVVGLGRGHPMETSLPFGVMTALLEDVGGRGLLGEDQPRPATPGDRAARFYGVLRWLRDRAGGALLLAIDDLHWADADSLALVSFLCRRMGSLRAGLIATLRPWPAEALQIAEAVMQEGRYNIEHLAPLSEAAAGTLIEARLGRPLAPAARHRAFMLCAGNPLLLEQLAVAIGEGGQVPEAAGAGTAAAAQGVLLARFAGLPAAGMRCAQAASVLGTSFQPEIAVRLAGLEESEADTAVEALARAGLIAQRPGGPADFVHPLFGQALYEDLAGPVRARLHARAFTVLHARGLDAQAAEHAVKAGLAGDLEAAAVLEQAGRAARRAGAVATAVTWLDAAVAMAGDQAGAGLLLAQAEALLVTGQLDRAVAAYRHLLGRPAIPVGTKAEALWMLGRTLVMTGEHDRAAAAFGEAADLAAKDDPGTAVAVLLDASFSAVISTGPASALPAGSRARELAASLGPQLRTRADAAWGGIAVQAGDPAGIAAVQAAAPWQQAGGHGGDVPGSAWGTVNDFAFAMALVERLTESERAFATLRASADRASLPEAIALLADGHGYALTRMGRLDEALEAINTALSLADLAPVIGSFAGVGRAYIQLYRGELDDSARWCERVEADATARGEWNALLFLWDVLGHRRLREGAAAEACEHYARLEAMVHRMGIGEPCLPPWARHGIGAYLAAGRTGDAERVLAWLHEAAQRMPCRFPKIAAATGRAWLAELGGDQARADAHHRAALALHGEVDLPVEHAETLLGYGAFLRRSGQAAGARRMLAQAAAVAEAAGARWLAGLSGQELKVAGGRSRRRSDPAALSAQEERVAALAAAGAANADIARQLYLSVSTVETHLQHIYAKLGIHTRYQLIAKAADAGWGTATPAGSPGAQGPGAKTYR
jgi:DNA-binding CsgD family transcriptional regulator